jgi:DNA-binding MarR family transcriptional regulator
VKPGPDSLKPRSAPSDRGAEREIADKRFESLNWESRRSSALLGMLNRAVAQRVKLNATDVETLGVLAVVGTITPTRLASLMAMGTGTMTLVIDRLERAGYVRRVRDTRDRRSITIEIIGERVRELGAFYAPLRAQASEISGRYTDEELAVVVDYLTHANDLLADLLTDLAGLPAQAGEAAAEQPGHPAAAERYQGL